jgi:polysaccharide export outer membrane protein
MKPDTVKKTLIAVAMISSLILSTGCTVKPRASEPKSEAAKAIIPLPVNSRGYVSARPASYRLGYGDVIEVKFFHNSEYNETVAVRPDGRISLQRIGDIDVVGMTPMALDDIVTESYAEILVNPDVTVIVREFGGQEVYVLGEVDKPGMYSLTKGMTILRAVAAAGGAKRSGKMNSIMLVRSDEEMRQAEVSRLDVSLSSMSENIRNDLPLKDYDIVYVPKTFVADVSDFITQLYDIILPPFDVWSRWSIWSNR